MPEQRAVPRIAVLGAGSWGTALAIHLARVSVPVTLWGPNARHVARMRKTRENADYHPGIPFPDRLELSDELATAAARADVVLLACPSHAFHELLEAISPHLPSSPRVTWATKGFEPGTGRFLHEVLADVLGTGVPGAVVTGPSFAREVAQGKPTAVTVASPDMELRRELAGALHGGTFRAYTSDDIKGAELGGAAKNVYAIATGIADGMDLGTNARAALITRSLREMMVLGEALGARRETLTGLTGVGDLVLTCTGDLSRNRRLGLALGAGRGMQEARKEIRQVVEGVDAAAEVVRLAERLRVEMPIAEVVHRILGQRLSPREGLEALLAREQTTEF